MGRNKEENKVMEHLMTYGWAYLLILIAIGAMSYFGVFGGEPARCDELTNPGADCQCSTAYAEDYDNCKNAQFKAQGVQVCRELIDYHASNDYEAHGVFMADVNTLEETQVVAVELEGPSRFKRFESDQENGTKYLHAVECNTRAFVCPRQCEPDVTNGCFCYRLILRTYIDGGNLTELVDRVMEVEI